jgi:hypothetical protein
MLWLAQMSRALADLNEAAPGNHLTEGVFLPRNPSGGIATGPGGHAGRTYG